MKVVVGILIVWVAYHEWVLRQTLRLMKKQHERELEKLNPTRVDR